jgi:hypothetical protein
MRALAGHKSSEPDIVIREGRELMYTVGARPRDFECSRHQKSATVCHVARGTVCRARHTFASAYAGTATVCVRLTGVPLTRTRGAPMTWRRSPRARSTFAPTRSPAPQSIPGAGGARAAARAAAAAAVRHPRPP